MKNPNQYGSVFKMSGKRRKPYRIRKMIGRTPEGKPIYINIGYATTRAEGMMMLAEYNTKPWDTKRDYTFKEVGDMYLKVAEHQLTKVSFKNARSHINKMKPLLEAPIKNIKTLHLQDAINELNGGHRSKANVRATINQVFLYALQNDLIDKNYVEFVKINKDTEEKVEKNRLFSVDEIKRTMNTKDNTNFDVVKVLLHSGFRITELLEVKHENVNLEEGYIRGGKKTEAGKDRIVPISRHIREVVEKHYDMHNEYLFLNQINERIKYSGFSKWFAKNYKDNVIHDTRHTFITKMSETNANQSSVKRIVGHASKDITERVYTHKSLGQLKEAMEQFDAHMDGIYE